MKAEGQKNAAVNSAGSAVGMGCLILFGLPFAGAGVIALFQGIKMFQSGKQGEAAMLGLMGTLFTLVGFGLMIGAVYGMRVERERNKRKVAHPGEPWRWREDWSQGRVDSQGKSGAIVLWGFAIFWNLISSTVLFALPKELAKGNKGILVALIFPLIGFGLLAGAIYSTLQRRKYGQPVFKLLNTPCVIGGQLAGMVEIPAKVKATSGFKVRLSCVEKRTTGSGDDRSTRETVLWQEGLTIAQDLLAHQPDKTGIPVQFAIPSSAPEASRETEDPAILWRLNVEADVRGVDLNETFELPVFRTAESPAATASEVLDPTPRWDKQVENYTPPAGARIQVQSLPAGGSVVTFAAARNVGAILFLFFFTAVFGGAVVLTVVKKAPILFPIVFGFFTCLLLLCCFNMLFHSSRVEADASGVRLKDSWIFYRKESRYAAAEIADVVLKNGMQSGNKIYYDVQLRLISGRDITLGSSVPDGEHAGWLAAVIRQAAGVKKAE